MQKHLTTLCSISTVTFTLINNIFTEYRTAQFNTFIFEMVFDSFRSAACIFNASIVSCIFCNCIPYDQRIFNGNPRVRLVDLSIFIHSYTFATRMWTIVPLHIVAETCVALKTNRVSAVIWIQNCFCTQQDTNY